MSILPSPFSPAPLNRMAEPAVRNRKPGRKPADEGILPKPLPVPFLDRAGRRCCPSCKACSGVRRDGVSYANGSTPYWCASCGSRMLVLDGMVTLTG